VDEKLTARQVRGWLATVEVDLQAVDQKLKPLLEEQRQLEQREELLRHLLASFDQAPTDRPGAGATETRNGSIGEYVIGRAAVILREEGAPLHINDLYARFVERGYKVPGKGRPVNLTVHLRSTDRIVSPQRGIYGLPEQVDDAPPRRSAKKRKRPSARRRGS
jgi:hypothetical protein